MREDAKLRVDPDIRATLHRTAERYHDRRRKAERRGLLRVVFSPDGRNGSLRSGTDATMFSALLAEGQQVGHQLAPGRSAWLHMVCGEVTVGDVCLQTGDGFGVAGVCAISITATAETELILVDLEHGEDPDGEGPRGEHRGP